MNIQGKKVQITFEGAKVATATIGGSSSSTSTTTSSQISENSEISKISRNSEISTKIVPENTGRQSKGVPSVPKAAEAVSGTIGSTSAPLSTSTSTKISDKSEISEISGNSKISTEIVNNKSANFVGSGVSVGLEHAVASVRTGSTSASCS